MVLRRQSKLTNLQHLNLGLLHDRHTVLCLISLLRWTFSGPALIINHFSWDKMYFHSLMWKPIQLQSSQGSFPSTLCPAKHDIPHIDQRKSSGFSGYILKTTFADPVIQMPNNQHVEALTTENVRLQAKRCCELNANTSMLTSSQQHVYHAHHLS